MKFIIGKKLGMTQIFDKEGACIPVTVIQAGPCYIVQIKTMEKDGYCALKLGFGTAAKEKNLSRAHKGQFIKNNIKVLDCVSEFRVDSTEGFTVGQEIKADVFTSGDYVDVSGISKAKGFQGAMKRHGFHGSGHSHGHHEYRRAPGSIGGSSFPSRVFKGTRMPGRMGNDSITTQKLKIVDVNADHNILYVKGAVPGNTLGIVCLESTVKKVSEAHKVPVPAPAAETKQDEKKKEAKKKK